MASRKPSKPKMLKLPKKPKQSAPLATWERYAAKVAEIEKQNKKREADYKKALNSFEAAKKKKAALINKLK